MTQALPKLVSFAEFIDWYPNTGVRYELHDGVIVEMPPPTGDHEKVVGFLGRKLTVEFDRLNLPYTIPKTAFVKPDIDSKAYLPDILLLNLDNLGNEPLWKKQSTVTQAASVPLVVEVVSTNWRDDYYKKFADYEEMGIPEYWIADYAARGGTKFLGEPKQASIFVCELINGEYRMNQFQGNSRIVSPAFPELNLTAQQIFDAA
ncbi:MAG: Uma2 family endonuclease [Calothrix sp. MO_167.B42]|nr:Uma2 family endonuclease [Calothrix sp. MO_167.B42]